MTDPNQSDNWWQAFFKGPWESIQLEGYPEARTKSEVDFVLAALQIETGLRVLDVPCGAWRHSIELARRGFLPTGIDFNAAAIAVAANQAANEGLPCEFVACDMREIDFVD